MKEGMAYSESQEGFPEEWGGEGEGRGGEGRWEHPGRGLLAKAQWVVSYTVGNSNVWYVFIQGWAFVSPKRGFVLCLN